MNILYKGSDLLFNIYVLDNESKRFRVNDIWEFDIKFYTSDPKVYLECSKSYDFVYTNMKITTENDICILNSSDLEKLDYGVIKYEYHLKVVDNTFSDGYYDEIVTGETDVYLKEKVC